MEINNQEIDFNKLRDKVKSISIYSFLSGMGIEPKEESSTNYKYLSPFRKEKTASFIVSKSKNRWVDFGDNARNGDLIDLASGLWNDIGYRETILKLSKKDFPKFEYIATEHNEVKNYEIKKFIPEIKNNALLSYLKKRAINPEKVKGLVGELYFTMNGKKLFSLAFKNDAGGYELRSDLKFLGKITLVKKYFTHIKNNTTSITVFEGFTDFLSLQSYKPLKTDILVLNSCVNVIKAIPILQHYKKAYLMLDNDPTGDQTTRIIEESAKTITKDLRGIYNGFNDINEWILAKKLTPTPSLKN